MFNLRIAGILVILYLFINVLPALSQTQNGTPDNSKSDFIITGTVISADTKEPVPGAHIFIGTKQKAVTTDRNGNFRIVISAFDKSLKLNVTHIGFLSYSRSLTEDMFEKPLNIYLEKGSAALNPVTVLAHRVRRNPEQMMDSDENAFLPIDSGAFLKSAANVSGIRKGGFGIDPVLRGLSGSRLNVRLNGLSTTAAACPNRMDPPTSHIRLTDIERVEIHMGPHALQYGPAFGGTVNFIKRQPERFETFNVNGDVRAGFESNTGHRKTDFRINSGSKDWDVQLSGGLSSTGDYENGSGNTTPAGFESYDYSLDAEYHINDSQKISIGWGQSFIRDADFPALAMDMAIDDTYKLKSGYEWIGSGESTVQLFSANGYWSFVDHEMNNHNRKTFAMRDAVALAETVSYGFQTKAKGLLSSGTWSVLAGVDHQNAEGTRFVDFKAGPKAGGSAAVNLWQDAAITNAGIYAGTEHYSGSWTFTVGSRVDLNMARSNDPAPRFENLDTDSDHFNFSISGGATKSISGGTSIGMFLSRGVRSPDITERYINFLTIGQDGFEYSGNPSLKAETNNQVDFMLQSRIRGLSFETTLFASYMSNYISAEVDPELQPVGMGAPGVRVFQNRGDALFTGFELNMEYAIARQWYLNMGTAYTRAEYRDTNLPVSEIPPLEMTFALAGSIFSGNLTPEISGRKVFAQNRFDESFGEERTPGFWVVDVNTGARIYKGVSLSAGIRNLLDNAYFEHLNRRLNPGIAGTDGQYLYEPGRSAFLELNVQF